MSHIDLLETKKVPPLGPLDPTETQPEHPVADPLRRSGYYKDTLSSAVNSLQGSSKELPFDEGARKDYFPSKPVLKSPLSLSEKQMLQALQEVDAYSPSKCEVHSDSRGKECNQTELFKTAYDAQVRMQPERRDLSITTKEGTTLELPLFLAIIEAWKSEGQNRREGIFLEEQRLQEFHGRIKILRNEYLQKIDEQIARAGSQEVLTVMNTLFAGVSCFLLVGSVLLAIPSVGASLAGAYASIPGIFAAVSGVAGVSGGATSIVKGVVDHKAKITQGALAECQASRKHSRKQIQDAGEGVDADYKGELLTWEELSKMVRAAYKASQSIQK